MDMKIVKLRSLLPQGEGQDEGGHLKQQVTSFDPLTPTLSALVPTSLYLLHPWSRP
jgi:hypothetical protein